MTKDQSKQIVDQAVQLANFESVTKEELPSLRLVDLSGATNNFSRLDFTVEEPTNENSCFMSYYQYGRAYGAQSDRMDLLNQVAMQFLQEPTFDQLRTKE